MINFKFFIRNIIIKFYSIKFYILEYYFYYECELFYEYNCIGYL